MAARDEQQRVADAPLHSLRGTAFFATAGKYALCTAGLRAMARRALLHFSDEFRGMSRERQLRMELYGLSTVNAAALLAYSLWWLPNHGWDLGLHTKSLWYGKASEKKWFERSKELLSAMLGYMVHDLISLLPGAASYPADIVHHVAGIGILTAILTQGKVFLQFVPQVGIIEATTVLLNLMWFLRETNRGGTAAAKAIPKLFAVLFLVTRVLFFPINVYFITRRPEWKELGRAGQLSVYTAILLQWYWFSIILRKFLA